MSHYNPVSNKKDYESNSFLMLSRQLALRNRYAEERIQYIYTNENDGYRKLGIHNKEPKFTFDVSGDVNVTGNYYVDGYILIPSGTIIQSASVQDPSGWIKCDGREVSAIIFPELYAAIGTTYGIGSLPGTFKLPDFRGRVGVGSGTGVGLTTRNMGDKNGTETHTLSIEEIPKHTHSYTGQTGVQYSAETIINSVSSADETTNPNYTTGSAGGLPDGSTKPHENMQPFIVVNYFIKY